MKREQITILSCKYGKIIEIGYYHIAEDKNYTVKNDEIPHPDLLKALSAFDVDLAEAHYVMEKDDVENFDTKGFVINEKSGNFYLVLHGKLDTCHGDSVNVSSGKIPYEENGNIMNNIIEEKLMDLREALFQYMFEGINAQGKLPFKEETEEKKTEKKK